MGSSFNTIQFHAGRCDGCGDCMLACARAKSGIDDRSQSRISILANDPFARTGVGGYELALCRQWRPHDDGPHAGCCRTARRWLRGHA